ncbi:MAG: arsenic efflux protein [Clostridia bacterium]|nr:arsenic efflux protein [Clostridia bacterium]
MLEVLQDTLIDGVKILPFLFLTYLLMEYIEHKTSNKAKERIKKSGKFGPFFGSLLGVVPQCGFSVSATNLYAARVITLGTLISVYLSTSDEMIPVMISESFPVQDILKILAIKFAIGMIAGFIIDFVLRLRHKNQEEEKIEDICEHDHCHCEKGILKSAIHHTLHIFVFILLITFALNTIIFLIGEENIAGFLTNQPILGPIIASLIGLIPNCASSVIITELYVGGVVNAGTLIAGLLVNAGVGLAVLFRTNKGIKQNLLIIAILYIIGVVSGILLQGIGLNI